jgi:hypothetical protein
VEPLHHAQLLRAPPGQRAPDLIRPLVAELLLQVLGPKLRPPKLVGRRQIRRTRRALAIERVDVVPGKIELVGAQQVTDVDDLLLQALKVASEDRPRGAGVARGQGRLRQGRSILSEFVDVRLQEQRMRSVESVEIAIQEPAGQLGIEWMVREL